MRETIYIQAGPISNLVGAHFFATQFSYYPLDDSDESPVDLETSLRNVDTQNPTPRAIVFDFRDNFRGIPVADLGDEDDEDGTKLSNWNGQVERHSRPQPPDGPPSVWSQVPVDFPTNALFTIPNFSSTPSWDVSDPDLGTPAVGWGDYSASRDRYRPLQEDAMERVRWLAEECDLLQGVQTSFDSATFGAFGVSMLSDMSDDLGRKAAMFAVPIFSSASHGAVLDLMEEPAFCRRILNDALVMSMLDGADDAPTTLVIPLQSPQTWQLTSVKPLGSSREPNSLYEKSALLSAQLESATLSTRLRGVAHLDFHTLAGRLNWRTTARIASLAGSLAFNARDQLIECPLYDFSASAPLQNFTTRPHAAHITLRGLSERVREPANAWLDKFTSGLSSPLLQRQHAFAYPLHSTFPSFMAANNPTVLEAGTVTALTSSSAPAAQLEKLAKFVDKCVRTRVSPEALGMGDEVDLDMLKEAAERLWTMRDCYADDEGRSDD